jgi:hypothetical protein
MTGDRHQYLRGAAYAAVAALTVAGCTWRGGTPKTTTTVARPTTTMARPTTTMGGHDHTMPDKFNHPPTEQQKKDALAWVDATRAALKEDGITAAKLPGLGYINIGDGVHWVKPEFTGDTSYLDPHRIESYAVFGGQIAAAMYVYNPKGVNTTLNDVPDIAGNWTMFHGHQLPYRSADPNSPDFFRLGAGPDGVMHWRSDSPMIHVWYKPNKCGPWASAGVGEGSCIPELANY